MTVVIPRARGARYYVRAYKVGVGFRVREQRPTGKGYQFRTSKEAFEMQVWLCTMHGLEPSVSNRMTPFYRRWVAKYGDPYR